MSNVLTINSEITQKKNIATVISNRVPQHTDEESLWEKLNLSQQYSVCSLGQFGYLLTYVRTLNDHTLAILKLGKKLATINEAGNINMNPGIDCR